MSQGLTAKPGYRCQTEDTSVEADVYLFNRLRQLTQQERVILASAQDRNTRRLCLTGIEWRYPEAPLEEIRDRFARAVLSEQFPPHFQPIGLDKTMWVQDSISLAQTLHPIFEAADLPYYISGGVASSIHGEARSTRDLDLVIQIQEDQVEALVTALRSAGFYCPDGAVEEVKSFRSKLLNITHTETIANADLYVMEPSPFSQSQMARRRLLPLDGQAGFWLISAEDLILQKLLWRRNSTSEKQWRDILGVLKVQTTLLDYAYLLEWAEQLRILDALNQALLEAGV
ncbi:MAG: hypothetical protein MUF49_32495, partial [Oculatellaceae cyanobacterium Prado106]|jgi:hypothetical protein|nr:hypothetical protein [Oculatellaceae cyanobacterium Prado106]